MSKIWLQNKVSKETKSIKKLVSSITFKKNMKGVAKLKKIGRLIQKKAIKELKQFIDNVPKKT